MRRRDLLGGMGSAFAAGLAGCAERPGSGGGTKSSVRTVEVESSVSVAVFRWGMDRGVWADRGVDLSFETAPFGRYNRQIVEDEADVGAPSAVAQLDLMAKGEALTFVAPQQNMFNRMFALADADITDPTDLAGATLGLPAALSSTTSTVHRTLVADEYGFDLVEDTAETRAADPPALWELLHDGELDAVSQFSGFTIRGIADDRVKTVFDPYALWTERTGVGIPTTAFTVRPSFLDENPGVVDDFLAGWADALESFQDDVTTALDDYGEDAGITEQGEADVVRELMADDVVFGPATYDADLVGAHWEFFELLAEAGEITLGARDETFATADQFRD